MENLKIFDNKEFGKIRILTIDDELWFVGKDIAEALGYKDTSDSLKRHVDDQDKLTRNFTYSGQNRGMYIINESGLYSLILSSKLPTAKKFKRWVTNEILPSIRKHGAYMTTEKIQETFLNPDVIFCYSLFFCAFFSSFWRFCSSSIPIFINSNVAADLLAYRFSKRKSSICFKSSSSTIILYRGFFVGIITPPL